MLERRTGIPITLAVVGIEVGRRIGVPLAGVGMPGHFLVRHDGGGDPVFVDAFSGGRLLDEAGCEALFRSHQPAGAAFDPSYLDPVRPRAIVERMLANLRAVYAARRDPDGLAWVTALRQVLGAPALERRELARVMAAVGRYDRAGRELEALAEAVPGEADSLLAEAQALRARLN